MVTRYKVRLSTRAQTDLNQIFNYLRRKASSRVATQVRKAIFETIKTLHTFPESHAIFEEISDEHVVFR
jgi:plasmid stabilization system protein ParE